MILHKARRNYKWDVNHRVNLKRRFGTQILSRCLSRGSQNGFARSVAQHFQFSSIHLIARHLFRVKIRVRTSNLFNLFFFLPVLILLLISLLSLPLHHSSIHTQVLQRPRGISVRFLFPLHHFHLTFFLWPPPHPYFGLGLPCSEEQREACTRLTDYCNSYTLISCTNH